jgi:hypothetical protein
MAFIEDVPRPGCRFSGSLQLVLQANGNTVTGMATYESLRADALIEGIDPVFCTAGGQVGVNVVGEVSSSAIELSAPAGNRTWCAGACEGGALGSFTTDLMRGLFTSSNEDLSFRGCFQVIRVEGSQSGAIPDCNPFEPGRPFPDADAGVQDAGPTDGGASLPDGAQADASPEPVCSEPRRECGYATPCADGERCFFGGPEQFGCCAAAACDAPGVACRSEADCCGDLLCLGAERGTGECRASEQCVPTAEPCTLDLDCCPGDFCGDTGTCAAQPS